MTEAPAKPFRLMPALTELTTPFWTRGAQGELVMQACTACDYIVHPPVRFCPRCSGREVAPRVLSGRATVHSFTINHHPWNPLMPPPYVIALVTIAEQDDVRLMTNIVGCDVDAVTFGLEVQATFEQHDDIWIPLFEPVPA